MKKIHHVFTLLAMLVAVGLSAQCNIEAGITQTPGGPCGPVTLAANSNGQAPLSYTWSTGEVSASIIVLAPNTYDVTITDANGCTAFAGIGVEMPGVPTGNIVASPSVICPGGTTTLTAPQGTTYTWGSGATTQSITVNEASGYEVTVCQENIGPNLIVNGDFEQGYTGFNSGYTQFAGTRTTGVYRVAPAWNLPHNCVDHTNNNTNGGRLLVDGITNAGVYVWDQFVDVQAGVDYTISFWVAGTNINPPQFQWIADGGNIGTVLSFTPPSEQCDNWTQFTFHWVPLVSGPQRLGFINLVTSANGNDFNIDDIELRQTSVTCCNTFGIDVSMSNVGVQILGDTSVCAGNCTEFTAQTEEGTGEATYNWVTGATTATISACEPGVYCVTITNNDGCTASACAELSLLASPSGQIVSSNGNTLCPGATTTLTAPQGTSYAWGNGATTNTITANEAGNYAVTVCQENLGPNLIVNGDFEQGYTGFNSGYTQFAGTRTTGVYRVAPAWNLPHNCVDHTNNNTNGGRLLVDGIGTPGVYVWEQFVDVQAGVDYTISFWVAGTNINPPQFQWLANDANIGTVQSFTPPSELCDNWTQFTFHWVPLVSGPQRLGFINLVTSPNGNDFNIDDIELRTNVACCQTFSIDLQNSNINVQIVGDSAVCPGACTDLSAVAQEGAGEVTFNWNTGATTASIQACEPGQYCVTMTDGNNCTASACFQLSHLASPTGQIVANGGNTLCPGASTTLTAPQGTSYVWGNGATTNTITANEAGNYAVTVCQENLGPNLIANGDFEQGNTGFTSDYPQSNIHQVGFYNVGAGWEGPADQCVDANPGTLNGQVMYIDGDPNTSLNLWCQDVNVVAGTTYRLSLEAAGGNIAAPNFQWVINGENVGPNLPFTPAIEACDNWQLLATTWTATTTGSVQLCLRNMEGAGLGNDFLIDDLQLRTTVECCQPFSIDLMMSNVSVQIVGDTAVCPGTCTDLTAVPQEGAGEVTYNWNNGATTATIQACELGGYCVTMTDGAGCTASACFQLSALATPSGEIVSSNGDFLCPGASTTLTAPQGSTYVWGNGATTGSITTNTPGSYAVTVCQDNLGPNLIFNGDFELGDTGFGSGHTPFAGVRAAGVYRVAPAWNLPHNCVDHTNNNTNGGRMLVDGSLNAGVVVWEQFVNVQAGVNYTISYWVAGTNINPPRFQWSANNANIGTVQAFNPPSEQCDNWTRFTLNWVPLVSGSQRLAFVNLSFGLGGDDFNIDDIELRTNVACCQPFSFNLDASSLDVSIAQQPSGCGSSILQVQNEGGIEGLSFVWSTGSNSPSITVNTPGNYCVTVTNNLGCTASACADAVFAPAPVLQLNNVMVTCGSSVIASATIPANVTYLWQNGATTANLTVTQTGSYCCTITDPATGCTASNCITTPVMPAIRGVIINSTATPNLCLRRAFSAVIDGGTAPYTYQWNFGGALPNTSTAAAPSNINYPGVGSYNVCVTVTDAMGCSAVSCQTFQVGEPCSLGDINFCYDLEQVNNGFKLTVFNVSSGCNGTSNITYSYNGGASWTATANKTFTTPGIYNVCVKIRCVVCGQTCESYCCKTVVVESRCDFPTTVGLGVNVTTSNTVNFSASTLAPVAAGYDWDFNGDGTYDLTTVTATATQTYAPGTHTACVRIRRSNDCYKVVCRTFVVNPLCDVSARMKASICTNSPQDVTFEATNLNNVGTVTWLIEDNPNVTLTGLTANHHFSAPGVYYVTMRAFGPDPGCFVQLRYRINVENKVCAQGVAARPDETEETIVEITPEEVSQESGESGLGQASKNMKVFPNPATQTATMEFSIEQDQEADVQITDLNGHMVWSNKSLYFNGVNQVALPIGELANGVYLVRLTCTNGMFTEKLVIQK